MSSNFGAPIVHVNEGSLQGLVVKNFDGGEYLAFRGIPYAEPPLGDLRFKEPRPPRHWNDIRDVSKFTPKAAQRDFVTNLIVGEEDCLYLHVATNSLIGKKPVIVWIHGGGFVFGGSHSELYGPDFLIKHDIVFVAVTYRLGCLGFLNLDITEASGNQGLKDQVAALKWVRENIRSFGGDPDNVTLMGHSAGSACVHLLTLSPLAKGLFHKAIAQSGVCLNPWTFEENPLERALRLTEIMGKKTNDPTEAWKFLMSASTSQLMAGQKKMCTGNMDFDMIFNFRPSLDLKSNVPFMSENPREFAKRGVNVPLLIGYTRDEGILSTMGPNLNDAIVVANNDFANYLARDMKFWDTKSIEKIANNVREYYFDDNAITIDCKQEWSKFKGEVQFINGIQEIVELQMEKATPTYFYRFSYRATYPTIRSIINSELKGACHGDENGALFHSSAMLRNKTYERGTRDRLIMERMTRMWTNFAKFGNPTPESNKEIPCKWEPLKKNEKNYLEISDYLMPGRDPNAHSWDYWKNILVNLQ